MARRGGQPDEVAARELILYLDNEEPLYRQKMAISKNLATKKARGTYIHELAWKAFSYLAASAAKSYNREFGGAFSGPTASFSAPTRKLVANELANRFLADYRTGEYGYLLPKKYKAKNPRPRRRKAVSLEQRIKDAMAGS